MVLGEQQDCFENTDIWGLIPQCIQLHGMETSEIWILISNLETVLEHFVRYR